MKLSIVIPVFNNWNFTKSTLNDLMKLPKDHEVVLVDNGSVDETSQLVSSNNLIIHRFQKNTGFGAASNRGYELARGEFVLFLNNDIRVLADHSGWTQALIRGASEGAIVGPTGGLLDKYFNFVHETNIVEPGNFYMSGWCLCGAKTVFDKLVPEENEIKGPFSQEFFAYFEDTDLGFRIRELRIPFKIIPVPVVHFGKMTSRRLNTSELFLNSKKTFVNKWTGR